MQFQMTLTLGIFSIAFNLFPWNLSERQIVKLIGYTRNASHSNIQALTIDYTLIAFNLQ